MPHHLNKTDQLLIALLRGNARMPITQLAQKLGVSRATVQNRIDKLEQNGIIMGYTVLLKPELTQAHVRALMLMTVESRMEPKITEQLKGFPNVVQINSTNGHWDLIAEVHADNLGAFHDLLGQIRLLPGVVSTETTILLANLKA